MAHEKEEGTYHRIEKLMKKMPGFLSPGKGMPLLLIPNIQELIRNRGSRQIQNSTQEASCEMLPESGTRALGSVGLSSFGAGA